MSKSMGSHQSSKMITDTWLTPPHIIHSLGDFDLDPCTPAEMPWRTAEKRYTEADNGLVQPWEGRVWLNPPYSREAVKWLKKMAEHNNGTALIFARTETSWFFDYIWRKASAVLFLEGRIYFHRPDGTKAMANAGAPSVLAAYGSIDAMKLKSSKIKGHFVWIDSVKQ
jgi:phage N-6-adenine-methyltransferase